MYAFRPVKLVGWCGLFFVLALPHFRLRAGIPPADMVLHCNVCTSAACTPTFVLALLWLLEFLIQYHYLINKHKHSRNSATHLYVR